MIAPQTREISPLDEWLLDGKSRARFMRTASLFRLTETLVASRLGLSDALAVLLDELGEQRPLDSSKEVRRMQRWIARASTSIPDVAFSSLILLVSEGTPCSVELALGRTTKDWPRGIVFRARRALALGGLTRWLGGLDARVAQEADYIMPIAYTALSARDALACMDVDRRIRSIRVAYTDGDDLVFACPRKRQPRSSR